MHKKTKILCTIGPSTKGVDNLVKLIDAGMDAARLNFSHGSYEDHEKAFNEIREASAKTGKPIAIIQDLQGPKIRVGKMPEDGAVLKDGSEFVITMEDLEVGDANRVSTTYKHLADEVKKDCSILLDDGYIILKVKSVKGGEIRTEVVKGGALKSAKGIVAPGCKSYAPSLSEKDINDLKFGLKLGVDAVAMSFVRSERDVFELKTAMKIFGKTAPIISKIERLEAVESIEAIIRESDGIMVARGDLGLEAPAEEVPVLQKAIISKCNYYGKPVITATQMLESMINNPRPTRAEASDVANAALDGTDCVMLSGETSVGKYPFDAVAYMANILKTIESKYPARPKEKYNPPKDNPENISDALGMASVALADQVDASAIIALTGSGYTPLKIAKYRPDIPIIALAEVEDALRFLSIVWGVSRMLAPKFDKPEEIYSKLNEILRDFKGIESGDNVVFVAGLSSDAVMPQNMLKVYEVD